MLLGPHWRPPECDELGLTSPSPINHTAQDARCLAQQETAASKRHNGARP
jgi:hypothetical protein